MGKRKLKRTLGFWDILMFGVGGIVGAGIYAIIGEAAALGGNMLWLSFVIAACVALLTGLSYAEFVSRFPDSGGSFEYIKQSLGPKSALVMSVFMVFTGVVAAAAISISFADYLSRLWELPSWIIVIGIIGLMAVFNIFGAKHSSYFNSIATLITITGLAVIIGVCLPEFGSVDLTQLNSNGWTGVLAGSALIFFSYIGFEDLVKMAEETKNPEKVMPRGILLSGLIVLLLYVLVAISSVSVLSWNGLAQAEGPLAAVIKTKLGSIGSTGLIIVALFATSKTILSNILGTSRLLYDIARDSKIKWLKKFTTISGIGNAPNYAIIAIALTAVGFGLLGNLKLVASISNIFIFIVFGMVNFSMIRYRYKNRKDLKKAPFHIPMNVRNIPIPTLIALLTILILFGYNIYNLTQGNL
ncbi:APC family permease [Psychroflexus sediminis]|uniref:Amino acid/polyamine/organocation transporter, APC superfamily n=1 Tax=Psychroflexus sediminis TaxID=470826 RepID=A0A1G7TWD4_9FLAO|nr:APC family permease [Psychroflexus sediminis]SDG39625.1 amino acid/polyamine/organocation transporter, APC superfamily [Psychroflexus sediminis]